MDFLQSMFCCSVEEVDHTEHHATFARGPQPEEAKHGATVEATSEVEELKQDAIVEQTPMPDVIVPIAIAECDHEVFAEEVKQNAQIHRRYQVGNHS